MGLVVVGGYDGEWLGRCRCFLRGGGRKVDRVRKLCCGGNVPAEVSKVDAVQVYVLGKLVGREPHQRLS